MHEASIVAALVRLAGEHAPAGARILSVGVRVGRLTAVSPEAMQFYFEVLSEDGPCAGARLEVELVPLRGRCGACGHTPVVDEAVWSCPACGEPRVTYENGDELELARLEVEDGGSDHHRAEDPEEERGRRPREP